MRATRNITNMATSSGVPYASRRSCSTLRHGNAVTSGPAYLSTSYRVHACTRAPGLAAESTCPAFQARVSRSGCSSSICHPRSMCRPSSCFRLETTCGAAAASRKASLPLHPQWALAGAGEAVAASVRSSRLGACPCLSSLSLCPNGLPPSQIYLLTNQSSD